MIPHNHLRHPTYHTQALPAIFYGSFIDPINFETPDNNSQKCAQKSNSYQLPWLLRVLFFVSGVVQFEVGQVRRVEVGKQVPVY
jgi:hypothetical protein